MEKENPDNNRGIASASIVTMDYLSMEKENPDNNAGEPSRTNGLFWWTCVTRYA